MYEDLNVKGLARGQHARAIHDAAFSEVRRQLTYKSSWYGKILETVDRWYASSKTCSECRYILNELRLDERQWVSREATNARPRMAGPGAPPGTACLRQPDINAARNLLAEGLRQLAGCDNRDLRVDAGDACPEEDILVQVLAEEARSGRRNPACLEQAWFG